MATWKERYQQTFTVPATPGAYAPERIAFGEVAEGMPQDSFMGVTASVDGTVATMSVELWLPAVGASAPFVNSDYKYSGKSIGATGAETWALAGYPGAQLRVKSGGTGGTGTVSATAF